MTEKFWQVDEKGQVAPGSRDIVAIADTFDAAAGQRMINHMNEDHVDAMVDYLRHAGLYADSQKCSPPQMIAIGRDGFVLEFQRGSANCKVKYHFPTYCETPLEVRKALVDMAKVARLMD